MCQQSKTVVAQCDPKLAQALLPLIQSGIFDGSLSPEQINLLQHQTGLTQPDLALALLPLAASYARAPLSDFKVGAIAQGSSGRWYFGANIEFPEVPLQQTVHAEQSAIIHAWLRGEDRLSAVTVNYTPCGHCRQFMNELNSAEQLTIYLPQQPPQPLHHYLPNAFGPKDLGITQLLFDPSTQDYASHPDPLSDQAIRAASQSYAPYSHAYSGVAIQLRQGTIITGRYAENAAFNPTLAPLQAALIALTLQGFSYGDIECIALAEPPSAKLSQAAATEALAHAIGVQQRLLKIAIRD